MRFFCTQNSPRLRKSSVPNRFVNYIYWTSVILNLLVYKYGQAELLRRYGIVKFTVSNQRLLR